MRSHDLQAHTISPIILVEEDLSSWFNLVLVFTATTIETVLSVFKCELISEENEAAEELVDLLI